MAIQLREDTPETAVVASAVKTLLFGTLLSFLVLAPIAAHLFLGFGFSTVLTQSMQPTIAAGDLEITRPVAARDITVGDVVVLQEHDTRAPFSHRVVNISSHADAVTITTRGDANPLADRNKAILGSDLTVPVVAATVPFAGRAVVYLASADGRTLGIVLLSVSAVLFLLRLVIRSAYNTKRKKTE